MAVGAMMRPMQVYLDERDLKSLEAWDRGTPDGTTKYQSHPAPLSSARRGRPEDPAASSSGATSESRTTDGSQAFRHGSDPVRHVHRMDHAFRTAGVTLWERIRLDLASPLRRRAHPVLRSGWRW